MKKKNMKNILKKKREYNRKGYFLIMKEYGIFLCSLI